MAPTPDTALLEELAALSSGMQIEGHSQYAATRVARARRKIERALRKEER